MSDSTEPRPYHHGNLRATILDAAERSLRKNGADQLSLRDLARDIGVSHAAPRRHFADRQALLNALAERGFVRLGAALRAELIGSDSQFPVRVRNAVGAFAHFATENAALNELMNSGKHRPGEGRIAEAADEAFRPMVELIVEGQDSGALEAGDPEKIGIILFATVQGITTMVNGGMVHPTLLDELIQTAVRQFLRGARPVA
jgi:AcrR family transcriptional regulator